MTTNVEHAEAYTRSAVGYPARAYVAWTLARWAAYDDPAPVPPGWTLHDQSPQATGVRQLASPAGSFELYNDAPARRIPWTCPAGVTHRRYWRSIHHPNRPPLAACEHSPEPMPLRP